MRRLLSVILLLLFGLPLVAPALALAGGEEAGLPACCRRGGAHHCMGVMQAEQVLSLRAPKCSIFPVSGVQARHSDSGFAVSGLCFAEIVSHPVAKAQVLARARVARDRARGMRGPPVILVRNI